MKRLMWSLFMVMAAATPAALSQEAARGVAQTPQPPPGLTLAEPSWVPASPTFFSSGGDIVPALVGGGGARGPVAHPTIHSSRAGNRISYTGGAPSSNSARLNFGGAIWRTASVAMTNTGASKIKSIRLEYVFTDPTTGAEVLRIKHRSKKRVRPGQSYVYTKTLNSSKHTRRGDGARMSVEVKEIVYADGSVWRPGGGL